MPYLIGKHKRNAMAEPLQLYAIQRETRSRIGARSSGLQAAAPGASATGGALTPESDGSLQPAAPLPPLSEWAAQALDFHPFPAQAEILDCQDSHVMLCCTRQFGKTTLTALKAAYHALSTPNTSVVVGSPGQRQSARLVYKAGEFLRRAGVRIRSTAEGTYGARLPNGSCIYALPKQETTTRGFDAVSLLIFEEAAYTRDSFYHMATPFQAVVRNRSLWLISTPAAKSGFFYEEWSDPARTHWRRFRVPATECPLIDAAFLAEERIRKGETVFRNEYECEFVSDATQIISRELWDSALDEDDIPFNGGKPLWND
ncbi:terminase large subunit domain-containing protein [Paludibaculum fermentans]|uniref:Terminase n=1 Tax=Paludibaculum fermentans TaxID=1473598 RepID=A0A7S7SIM2_PALFE|nr:terminase family protein [Paludibaculum fermentans]QOY85611.1 hypothetical protein IRI77_22625 [Paludibaculum fermentans]